MRNYGLVITLLIASIAFQMTATMLAPVLNNIAIQLNTTNATISDSQSFFYILASIWSILLLRLSDLFGRKKLLRITLLMVLLSSIAAALAPNIYYYFMARGLQACGGALLPLCLLILHHNIREFSFFCQMAGLITGINIGITGLGKWFNEWLISISGIEAIFYCIAFVTGIGFLLVSKYMPNDNQAKGNKIDCYSTILILLTALSLLLASDESTKLNLANPYKIICLLLISLVLGFLFYQACKRSKHPFLNPVDFANRPLWALLLTTTLSMTGMFAIVNDTIRTYAKDSYVGFALDDTTISFLFISFFAFSGMLSGCFIGKLAYRFGFTYILRLGLVSSVILLLVLLSFGFYSLESMVVIILLLGLTYAAGVNIMLHNLAVTLSPKTSPGVLPGLNTAAFHLGAGLSFTLLSTIQLLTNPKGSTSLYLYFNGVSLGIGIMIIALIVSFFIPMTKNTQIKPML